MPAIYYPLTGCDDRLLINGAIDFLKGDNSFLSVFNKPYLFDSGLFYRPLVTISFYPDLLIGNKPGVFHFFNCIYFTISAVLFYFILKCTPVKKEISILIIFLYITHPLFTNAVAWIPGRNDLLLTVFVLAAYLSLLKYIDTKKPVYHILLILFFTSSLFTKESSIAFIAFAVYYVLVNKKTDLTLRTKVILISSLVPSALFWLIIRNSVITEPAAYTFFKNSAFILQGLGKIMLPFNLSVLPTIVNTGYIYGIVSLILISALIMLSQGMQKKMIYAGIIWFVVFAVPSILNVNTEYSQDLMLECRLLLPSIGILTVIGCSGLFEKLVNSRYLYTCYFLIFAGFAVLNYSYSANYNGENVFWESAVKNSPDLDLSFSGLALIEMQQGNLNESIENYQKAAEINPNKSGINGKIALIFLRQNKTDESLIYLQKELAINPVDYDANLLSGIIYYKKTDNIKAEKYLLKAKEINLNDIQPDMYLMKVYFQEKNYAEALKYAKTLKSRGVKLPLDIAKTLGIE